MRVMGATQFTVEGPFDVPSSLRGATKHISAGCNAFWKQHPALAPRKGCYAFGIRSGGGIRLTYVGLTTRQSFKGECFARHKVEDHYNPELKLQAHGTPVLFLIVAPQVKTPKRRISELETFLINTCVANGIHLTNKRKRGGKAWTVAGVVPRAQGRPPAAATALRTSIGI
jgi:hypothetical protein